jgi:hypothetical protein
MIYSFRGNKQLMGHEISNLCNPSKWISVRCGKSITQEVCFHTVVTSERSVFLVGVTHLLFYVNYRFIQQYEGTLKRRVHSPVHSHLKA